MFNFYLIYIPKVIIFNSENYLGSERPDNLTYKLQRFFNVCLILSLCSLYQMDISFWAEKKS